MPTKLIQCAKKTQKSGSVLVFLVFFPVETPNVRGDDFDYPLEKHELRKNYLIDFDEILYAYC